MPEEQSNEQPQYPRAEFECNRDVTTTTELHILSAALSLGPKLFDLLRGGRRFPRAFKRRKPERCFREGPSQVMNRPNDEQCQYSCDI